MLLREFPRPQNDSGRGLHFILDPGKYDPALDVGQNVPGWSEWLKRLGISWTTVYGQDEQVVTKAAKYILDHTGAFSILRVEARAEHLKAPSFWAALATAAIKVGVAPYIQIFNEPESEGFSPSEFAQAWGVRARAVVEAGGYAGLQVMTEEYFAAVASGMAPTVGERLFLVPHCYGLNHPPAYPFSPYQPSAGQTVPGAAGENDDSCVLRFLTVEKWCNQYLGWVPPMIGGEGGWLYQNHDDQSFPAATADLWITWHQQMYRWFQGGVMANGEPLPDYLFAINSWLLYAANWYSDSWVGGMDEAAKKPLLDWLEQTAHTYVRKFSWDSVPDHTPLPDPELARLIRGGVFLDPAVALAVLLAESGGDPNATNNEGNNPPTSVDRGLYQFNSKWHPEVTDACAFDPECAVKAAATVTRHGADWSQWTSYKKGSYLKYMERAQTILAVPVPFHPTFTVTPVSIPAGGSAILAWDLTGAKAATGLGQGSLPLVGTQTVSPKENTLYGIEAVAPDGAIVPLQVMLAVVPLPPPSVVDPRCYWVTVENGIHYVVEHVYFYDSKPPDNPESEELRNLYAMVKDELGNALQHHAVTQRWRDGSRTHYTRNGMVAFEQSGDSNFDPADGAVGAYTLECGDARVRGMGLPLKQHVEYLVVFVRRMA